MPFVNAEFLDELLPAFSHALGNAGEVALFPKRLVRIHAVPSQLSAAAINAPRGTAAYSRAASMGKKPAWLL